jgi:hypothetical protein
MIETKAKVPMTTKNFGHMYLKKTLASFTLTSSLIAGAINAD